MTCESSFQGRLPLTKRDNKINFVTFDIVVTVKPDNVINELEYQLAITIVEKALSWIKMLTQRAKSSKADKIVFR